MSNSNDLKIPEVNTAINDQSDQEIIIELGNLTDSQKTDLFLSVLSFVIQIIYLTNLGFVTGLFKPFIAQSYNLVADYIVQFFASFVPYLIVIYFGFLVVSIYESLVNDFDLVAEVFDYTAMGSIIFVVFFFIAVFSIPTLPLSAFYPNVVELALFLFVICFSLTIAFAPFGVYKYLLKEKKT